MQQSPGERDPIDQLGTALMRATGILSALSACQDPSRNVFAVPDAFVMQAVAALEGFINEARNAYFDLCTTEVSSVPQERTATRSGTTPHRQERQAEMQEKDTVLPDFLSLRDHEAPDVHVADGSSTVSDDGYARSYDALLRKLTAAEVFAAERTLSHDEITSPLLPLLQSLRQDLERLRAA